MITRQRALEILIDHGQLSDESSPTLDDDSGEWVSGEWIDDSAFDTEVGVKDSYRLMEVLGWLGYCCKYC